jgi:His Kinase A (phospho-acceptor) domain
MLETLDPVDRVAPARDDRERRAAENDRAAARPWSSDWTQLGHELRTPLNAMLGNIELLLDGSAGPLAAPVRACVGDLQIASRQLLRQLQPLLLLVQARTAGAVASGLPIDLLALVRQAAAESAPAAPGQDVLPRRAAPRLPAGTGLMMAGDPVWLGALAATLVDLHATSPQAAEPLSIDLAAIGEAPGGAPGAPCAGAGGTVLRASWPGLEPAALSPLALALIDAVLALHGGQIRALDADGLRLDLPGASMVQCSTPARGHR